MLRLAHISDVHLGPLPKVSMRELASKRITGYVNWKLNRAHYMQRDTISELTAHMQAANPDFIAVTGDLVNLAARSEFDMTSDWLERLGSPGSICTIPGNHDIYVRGAAAMARDAWGDYMRGETTDAAQFPFVRRVGDVAIIACSSGVVRPPFFASGHFDAPQANRLAQWLQKLGEEGLFRVVLIHHPPTAEFASDWRRGMTGAKRFREVVAQQGAELVLHGHLHKATITSIPGPDGKDVPVIGVTAASSNADRGEEPARYNMFEIEKLHSGFACTLHEYGYQRVGDDIVMRLRMRLT